MSAALKYFLNALLAALVGGSIPAVSGTSWTEIISTALVAVLIALLNLWQHKPGVEPKPPETKEPL